MSIGEPSTQPSTREQFVDAATLGEAFATLKQGMKATKRVRGKSRGEYEDVPDEAIRLKAAEALISFRLGRPNQSSTNYNLSLTGSAKPGLAAPDVVQSMLDGGIDLLEIVRLSNQLDGKTVKQLEEAEEAFDV